MSEQTERILAEAFNLIEVDKLEDARKLLTPLLTAQPDNPDVWWLYAHAVTDADTARDALKRAASLNPNDPDIINLLEQVEKQAASRPAVPVSEMEPAFLADIPATLPDLPEAEDEFIDIDFDDADLDIDIDEEEKEEKGAAGSRLLPLAVLGTIVVLIIIAVAVITSRPQTPAAVTPTAGISAANPTETPAALAPDLTALAEITPEVFIEPTSIETTAELIPTDTILETLETPEILPEAAGAFPTDLASYTEALSGFQLTGEPASIEQTSLGSTLLVGICVTAGPDLRSALPVVMDTLARQPLPAQTDAVGARMVNCQDNTLLLLIVAAAADAQDYASGDLSEEEFQARWKSL